MAAISEAAFCTTFHALCRTAADVLRNLPTPTMNGWNVTFNDDGSIGLADGSVKVPGFAVGQYGKAIQGLSEYVDLRAATNNSAFLRTHLAADASTGGTFREDIFWMRVSSLLSYALLPNFAYDSAKTDDVIRRMDLELNKTSTTYLVRAYFRFSGPHVQAPLVLSDGSVIRAMTKTEREALVHSLRFYLDAGLTASAAAMFETVLETRFESEDDVLHVRLPRPLASYQTALRLIIGRVAFAFATLVAESVFGPGHHRTLLPHFKSPGYGDQLALLPHVLLKAEDVAAANIILDRLEDSPNSKALATAVRRYNDALERIRLDDALVDCVVGLESVLTREANTDVVRRLRQRLALLIGRSADDRVAVSTAVSKIYDARSRIAHGDEPSTPLHELLQRAEEYLGRLLRRLLRDTSKFDPHAYDITLIRGDGRFVDDNYMSEG
jgi:Apea-like HEPN